MSTRVLKSSLKWRQTSWRDYTSGGPSIGKYSIEQAAIYYKKYLDAELFGKLARGVPKQSSKPKAGTPSINFIFYSGIMQLSFYISFIVVESILVESRGRAVETRYL